MTYALVISDEVLRRCSAKHFGSHLGCTVNHLIAQGARSFSSPVETVENETGDGAG